jgi:DnaJ-class molecular chaperone
MKQYKDITEEEIEKVASSLGIEPAENLRFLKTAETFTNNNYNICTMCKGSGLHPVQSFGLTKVCSCCNGVGKIIKGENINALCDR